jgi:hypothetical protein
MPEITDAVEQVDGTIWDAASGSAGIPPVSIPMREWVEMPHRAAAGRLMPEGTLPRCQMGSGQRALRLAALSEGVDAASGSALAMASMAPLPLGGSARDNMRKIRHRDGHPMRLVLHQTTFASSGRACGLTGQLTLDGFEPAGEVGNGVSIPVG